MHPPRKTVHSLFACGVIHQPSRRRDFAAPRSCCCLAVKKGSARSGQKPPFPTKNRLSCPVTSTQLQPPLTPPPNPIRHILIISSRNSVIPDPEIEARTKRKISASQLRITIWNRAARLSLPAPSLLPQSFKLLATNRVEAFDAVT
jgi:hypothetical protein